MVQESAYLAELVRINDTLIWSQDRTDSLIAAVDVVRDLMGARIAPVYLLNHVGDVLVLVTDDATRAQIGEHFATMPAHEHIRPPWINDEEWPVSAADHLDHESWEVLPEDFRAWFGTSGVIVPIRADGRHLGAALLCFDGDWTLTPTRAEFLAIVGRILGNAVYRWQCGSRERELGMLEERRRLGDELHVDLSQQVAALGLHVGVMEIDYAAGDYDRLADDVDRLGGMVAGVASSLRHQMLGLRSDAAVADGSFVEQVRARTEAFGRQFGIPARLECPDDAPTRVPLAVAAQLVRVLQESLGNVQLHAQARSVVVRVLPTTTRIRLEVEDDGVGFDLTSVPDARLGVRIMTERMQQVDGVIRFEHPSAGGTLVVAEAPLRWPGRALTLPEEVTSS